MKHHLASIIVLGALLVWQNGLAAEDTRHEADVCVYGGTASGVMAALAAEKEGADVIIVEPSRWPGMLPEGKAFSTPVTAMDLTATVAAAGGAKPSLHMPFDGVDLLPALTDKTELKADRPLFFRRRNVTVHKNQNDIRQSAVRQGVWKYLRTYKGQSKKKFTAALYNLNDDIAEAKNLAESNVEKMKALSHLLDQWESEMSKTAIPFVGAPRRKK